jgi:hypothetical protein
MIVLKLELNEVNIVLQALGQMPYIQVNSVIVKLQEQAGPQAQAEIEAAAAKLAAAPAPTSEK